ncbi:MAG TPA: hypothetical protein VGI40_28260 [Pirellulaceae bacterium]|jgi:hypothetical protein
MSTSVASEKVNGQPVADPPPNPFDPSRLRLSQNFAATVGVKKVITTVPCRKPNRHEFVRVRSGEDWRLETGIFEDKQNRETYLVEPSLWPELMSEIFPACLFYTVTRQGDVMLWPVRLPGTDGKTNSWNESAVAAAKLAESRWVRVAANMTAGMYDVFEAASELAKPEWPDLPFEEILRLAFKDRFIRDMAHPTVKALRGEV